VGDRERIRARDGVVVVLPARLLFLPSASRLVEPSLVTPIVRRSASFVVMLPLTVSVRPCGTPVSARELVRLSTGAGSGGGVGEGEAGGVPTCTVADAELFVVFASGWSAALVAVRVADPAWGKVTLMRMLPTLGAPAR
jgi:hypothetical protein